MEHTYWDNLNLPTDEVLSYEASMAKPTSPTKVVTYKKYTKEEDELLTQAKDGGFGWAHIAKNVLKDRSASSIKQRYNLLMSPLVLDGSEPPNIKRQHLDQSSLAEESLSQEVTDKIFLNCQYKDKDEVKVLGAKWSATSKRWWIHPSSDITKFSKWLPQELTSSLVVTPNFLPISNVSVDNKEKIMNQSPLVDLLSIPAVRKAKEGIDDVVIALLGDLEMVKVKKTKQIEEVSVIQVKLDEALSKVKETEVEIAIIERKLKQLHDMFT
jgi:hypothetical protein